LFHIENVVNAALLFDLVAPSMDAVTEKSFKLINRPVSDITLSRMLESLINFSHEYTGTLLLEIFIVPGINDSPEELAEFKRVLSRMNITRIQLNSLDRPGTERTLVAATPQRLNEIAAFFSPLPVEIISRSQSKTFQPVGTSEDTEEKIYSIIKRRPVTFQDLVTTTALPEQEISVFISALEKKGAIQRKAVENNIFFQVRV
ncbi:MAG TPA: hypothetical protein VHO70_20600, partial [Chitinispirillaceae bacterium]|nr:hypothetical protein [Chitinispirillaceae bacterium]